MIKSELIQKLSARSSHLYQQDIEKIVNVVLSEITKAMTEGGRVELRGFGTFTTKSRTARIGRNPRTGTAVDVDAKRIPAFRTGRDMNKRLNDPQAALPVQTGADQ